VTLVVVTAIVTAQCRRAASSEESTGPIGVATQVVQLGSLQNSVTGPGTIVPSPGADLTIFAPEAGRIVELPKAEGDAVKTGDVLVKFEFANANAERTAREAQVQAATARLDEAKAGLAKISAMYDRGYVPRNNLEASRNDVVLAQTALAHATEALDMAKAATDRGVIKATFSGVIAKTLHAAGDMVNGSPSDPVLRVIDPTRTQVAMRVETAQVPLVQPGQHATVVSGTDPAGEQATVASRPTVTDPAATSVEVRLSFVAPTTLAVDTPVQVEILVAERSNVVVLAPATMLKADDGTPFVMMAGADSRAHRRNVTVGLTTRDRVEITSGLSAGDRIIVKGLDQLSDGTPIAIH
jgi:membrane fusion protein (multidrug efflux system)